jgi:hypothetical protein
VEQVSELADSLPEGWPPRSHGAQWDSLLQVRDVCELLWPPPAMVTVHGRGKGSHRRPDQPGWGAQPESSEFIVIRGGRRPLLVPASGPAAAAAIRSYRPQSSWARTGARALSAVLTSGLGRPLLRRRISVAAPPGADTIEAYLRQVAVPDLRVGMYLGPPRANRKPVLQLLTSAGRLAGFAKIGINPLTGRLCRTERAALAMLRGAGLAHVTVPQVQHYGQWHDLDVLVLNALPVWRPSRPLPAGRLAAAMAEVAAVNGVRQARLDAAPYLPQLRGRLFAADHGRARAVLLRALDAVVAQAGSEVLTFGAWHGDWTGSNMAHTDGGLFVWDWERFAAGVPAGFDVLHHWLQAETGTGRHGPLASAVACPGRAVALLAPWGIGARQARLTAILYMAELATRYLVDQQTKAGARHGDPEAWLIPAVTNETARLCPSRRGAR